jgi:4-hydroxy-tetrahydrodipicolinate synthase
MPVLRQNDNMHMHGTSPSPHPLAGVYAAAVTPLAADGTLDLDSIRVLLEFLSERGCHGALLLGTTGEGPSFSPSERLAILRRAADWRRGRANFRLLAGTGTPSLGETIELTASAFELGFDGVVVLPPYYFRTASDAGLFAWFRELIDKAVPGDGQLLGYHFPGVAGIGFSLDLLARLKDGFPVQFAGIKDSSHDPDLPKALSRQFGADLAVFGGTDSLFEIALEAHAAGCITAPANILSPGLRQVYDGFRRGEDVSAAQAAVSQRRHVLEKYLPFPPALKVLLHRQHGLPRWWAKPPLMPLSERLEAQLLAEFEALAAP